MFMNEAQPALALLPIHIIAGLIGLIAGAVALYTRKGAKTHRQSGMVFVYAMLVMSGSGAGIAVARQRDLINAIAGVLTFYLVVTAVLTVRQRAMGFRWSDLAIMLVALTLGIVSFRLGFVALNHSPNGGNEYPPPLYFTFGAVALLAAFGDIRMLLAGGIQGSQRIVRHLWRMTFALWIAAASFFLGQADEFPVWLQNSGLLAIPVLLILLTMLYWQVRVLWTKRVAHGLPQPQ